MKAWVAKLK